MDASRLVAAAVDGADEARGLWLPERGARVPRVASADLTRERFVTEFVSRNTPVVVTGAFDGLPAARLTVDGLVAAHGSEIVTVNATPDGWGDALVDTPAGTLFVKPEERRMSLADSVAWLRGGGDAGVPYVSHQNDSLRRELPALLDALRPPGGVGALGAPPWPWCPWSASVLDAVNVWLGDARSTSWVHKDSYENLYAVVAGEKRFTLFAPSDVLWLYERRFPGATYRRRHSDGVGGDGGWDIERDNPTSDVPWVAVQPAAADAAARFPLFAHATPLEVTLGPGDVLYLPALWYHQATQATETLAVNWWHDMDFQAPAYAYYSVLRSMGRALAEAEAGAEAE